MSEPTFEPVNGLHPAIAKRIDNLRNNHNYDPGPPLTALHDFGGGNYDQGFYQGIMRVYPDLDEAWFVEEKEGSFPVAQG